MVENTDTKTNLQRIMSEHELTHTQMSEDIGVNRSLISHWVKGKRPITIDKAMRLSKFYNIPLEEIIGKGKPFKFIAEIQCNVVPLEFGGYKVMDDKAHDLTKDISRDTRKLLDDMIGRK